MAQNLDLATSTDLATSPIAHSVSLAWTMSVTPTVTYNIYRGTTSGGPYAKIASGLTAPSYDDTAVQSGATYYYVATAESSSKVESGFSDQAQAVIP
jgi:fibronectin type 3 domain-containing protein